MSENPEIAKLMTQLKRQKKANRIMHGEIESLKKKLNEQSSGGTLIKKIQDLEKELADKNKIIEDLKSVAGTDSADPTEGSDITKLKTRIIVLQSKLRKKSKEMEPLTAKVEDYELTIKRLKKQLEEAQGKSGNEEELKKYQEIVLKYRERIKELMEIESKYEDLKRENANLKSQLKTASLTTNKMPISELNEFTAGNDGEIQSLREQLKEKDSQIKSLQVQLQSGGGSVSFMTQNRFNRKIGELEAQIKMLKKSESDMKRRYDDAMRKLAASDEFADW